MDSADGLQRYVRIHQAVRYCGWTVHRDDNEIAGLGIPTTPKADLVATGCCVARPLSAAVARELSAPREGEESGKLDGVERRGRTGERAETVGCTVLGSAWGF